MERVEIVIALRPDRLESGFEGVRREQRSRHRDPSNTWVEQGRLSVPSLHGAENLAGSCARRHDTGRRRKPAIHQDCRRKSADTMRYRELAAAETAATHTD